MREAPTPENIARLHVAEAKMHELKANMAVLGKEASAALAAVEAQQQRLSFQRLVAMVSSLRAQDCKIYCGAYYQLGFCIFDKFVLWKVEGERNYHQRIATILGEVEAEVSSFS